MFKKSDLKTGMFGKMSDGDLFVIVDDIIVYDGENGYDCISTMDDNLEFSCYKIDYLVEANSFLGARSNIEAREDIIWERNSPKKTPTMLEVFLESKPNAPRNEDGSPIVCPDKVDVNWKTICSKFENCVDCWNRPVPNAKEVV